MTYVAMRYVLRLRSGHAYCTLRNLPGGYAPCVAGHMRVADVQVKRTLWEFFWSVNDATLQSYAY